MLKVKTNANEYKGIEVILFFPRDLVSTETIIDKGKKKTRQSKHCGFSFYIFCYSKSKSMVRLIRAEKMVLSGLVFARKI